MVQDLQIFAISISFFYNLLVIVMLRQNRMEIRYSLPWIFAGIAILSISQTIKESSIVFILIFILLINHFIEAKQKENSLIKESKKDEEE